MAELDEYRAALLERLQAQPAELAQAIAAIPEAEWQARRASDRPTLHHLAAHLRDLEALAFLPRFRRVLAEANPQLNPFDSHHWSDKDYQPSEPMANILTDFARAREAALNLMQGMQPDDWSRLGFHPPSGWRTAQWWAERMYGHAQEHLAAIRGSQ